VQPPVNGERLWASLMELAEIGATPKGGVRRLAASDFDGEVRQVFIGWCEAAGGTVQVSSIFAPHMILFAPACTAGQEKASFYAERPKLSAKPAAPLPAARFTTPSRNNSNTARRG